MLRIFTIILLTTVFINFAYNSFKEASTKPKSEKGLVNAVASAEVPVDNTIEEKELLSELSPASGTILKKEKVLNAEKAIDKIMAEWVVPFKPKAVSNNSIDESIKKLAERTKAEKKATIKTEIYDESQYSYLAEPQLKPLNALTKPTSFLDPIGGKVMFKPVPPVYYFISSEDILKTQPVTKLQSKNLFATPASQANILDRKSRVKKIVNRTGDYRKRAFINNIGLAAADINQKIMNERAALIYAYKRYDGGNSLTLQEKIWVTKLAERYRVAGFSMVSKPKKTELLSKVNIVPESLAVAQAALESGWGKSSLAKRGYNYFGHKCFAPNCGTKPTSSLRSKTQYAVFASPKEAVEEYVHNLNTNSSYKKFRIAREYLGVNAEGKQLVHYLDGYSEQGNLYENKVKQVIDGNNLE